MSAGLSTIRDLVANDAHACTFQSFGQYRTALLKEIDAAMASDGWQPIATAPKDEILLLATEFDRPGDWRMKCGYYSVEMGLWRVWGASWNPTMWRPMPDAPVAGSAA